MAFVVMTVCAGSACAGGGPSGREVAPAQPGGQAVEALAAREAPESTGAVEATAFAAPTVVERPATPAQVPGVWTALTLLLLATLVATMRPVLRRD